MVEPMFQSLRKQLAVGWKHVARKPSQLKDPRRGCRLGVLWMGGKARMACGAEGGKSGARTILWVFIRSQKMGQEGLY